MKNLSKYKELMLAEAIDEMSMNFEPGNEGLNNPIKNEKEAIKILSTGKLIGEFDSSAAGEVKIYLITNDNEYSIYLLLKDKPFIACEYSYDKYDKCIENKVIWNFSWYRGLFREFFEKYIIPREFMIFSDILQSKKAFRFWTIIFEEYVEKKKTHKMVVADMSKKIQHTINSKDDMTLYYDKEGMDNFQFCLIKI
jgi:hypothetical protein